MSVRPSRHLALAAALAATLAACGRTAPPAPSAPPAGPQALFTNGDFEGGTLTGWAVSANLNYGIVVPPTSTANLQLQAGGATTFTKVVTGGAGSVIPAGLSAGATLRVPRYGSNVAVVNELGLNRNVNSIVQQMVASNADVDPADNKVHVRFAVAPVLENPSHGDTEQPYFWVQLRNVTKGTVLFYTFNFSNQSGVPWKADPVTTTTLYTDWQAFDIAPGPAALAVGDTVEMLIIAAGCSRGGHFGHLYVDAFGPSLPGLAVTATAPASVNTGGTLTYALTYKNSGPGTAVNAVIAETLPAGTTFASVSAPAGVTCATPAVGAAGTVTCSAGTVGVMGSGTILVTVNVTAASGTSLYNGNYTASATGASPLVGPLVTTAVTTGVTYANLGLTVSDGLAAIGWGQHVTYTLTASNAGPGAAGGATLTDTVPAQLTGVTWTCAATGGAACPAASGSGSLAATIATFPSGGAVVYTIDANVVAGSGTGTVVHQATLAAPAGVTDAVASNNVAVDTDAIGTLYGLTVQKAGAGTGSVLSSPSAISCGPACSSQTASYVSGTSVVLTATAAAGQYFSGWGGACAASGGASTCTVPVAAATTVTATFVPVTTLASSVNPAVHGQPVTFTATLPAAATGTVQFVVDGVPYGGPVTVAAGTAASLPTGALSTGSHTIQAVYSGDSTYPSTTATVTEVVNQAATTTALASSVNPSVTGQTVTFTATVAVVAPGVGTPTGTVTFLDGATSLGTGTLNASGVATLTTSTLAVGTHPVTAVYGASTDFSASTSAAVSEVVNRAATTTVVASSVNPSASGQAVIFTATVAVTSPGTGTPTGTVTFLDGATSLGSGTLNASGVATLTTSALAVGTHSITAAYGVSAGYAASTSSVLSQVVNRATTTTTLASSVNPSVTGRAVTFTATVAAVSPGTGTPTGTVTFLDGATSLGTGTLNASGVATLTTSTLAVGTHPITAAYAVTTSYAASTSAAVSEVVNRAATTTVVASSVNPSVSGQAVTFTATVAVASPGTGTPTGTVTFLDGATSLGTGTLNASGVATLTTSALAVGTHGITAAYGVSAGYAASTSAAVSQVVNRAATSTTVASSANPSIPGQAVTFTATVVAAAPGAGTPTGTVTFSDGATSLGTGTLDASGVATLTTSALAVGTHPITAAYAVTTSFAASTSAAVNQVVNRAATTTTLASSPNPALPGQAVTFTATVTSPAGTPGGTVTFYDGATVLGTGTLDAAGVATLTTGALGVGAHSITAVYGVTTTYATSTSAPLSQEVSQAPTTTAVTSSANPAVSGQAVTLTATVASGSGTPGGTVTFSDGATVLGTATLDAAGVATLTTAALAVGDHAIQATYGGATAYTASSGALTQAVQRATCAVTLVPAPASAVYGQPVVLSLAAAAVAPGAGIPSGVVIVREGTVEVGRATLDAAGQATITLNRPLTGDHALVADYAGDARFAPATANGAFTVASSTTAVAVATSRTPSRHGRPVTFTATVTSAAPSEAVPDGEVVFKADGVVLGTGTITDGVATWTDRTLVHKTGAYDITAEYAGTGDFVARTGTLAGGQTVENSPPVAGSGTALAFGPAGATQAAIPVPVAFGAGPLTLEAWARAGWTSPTDVTAEPTVASLSGTGGTSLALGIGADRAHATWAVAGQARSAPAPLDDGAWHHLAVVSTETTATLFVDGVQADTVSAPRFPGAGTLVLGQGLLGQVDEIRAWSVARTAADLQAAARSPLATEPAGLIGHWHLDERSGIEIFDASSGAHDGTVALASGVAEDPGAFVPSHAWRVRQVSQERNLTPPADAGYDPDGDPLTLTIAAAPPNGTASTSAGDLTVGYRGDPGFTGTDALTFQLEDTAHATDTYELELQVERILVCQVNADCAGGDQCVGSVCIPAVQLDARAGAWGCSTGGGFASGLWALLVLGLSRRRPRRERQAR